MRELPKFKILPVVHTVRWQGKRYFAGEIVELPERFKNKKHLKLVEEDQVEGEEKVLQEPEEEVEVETGETSDLWRKPVIDGDSGMETKAPRVVIRKQSRCKATTLDGTRCKNACLSDSDYCHIHQSRSE